MKKKYFLGGVLLVLIIVILAYGIYFRCSRVSPFLGSAYWGTCSVCRCLYEIPNYQLSIIRQGGKPTCLICPECQKHYTF